MEGAYPQRASRVSEIWKGKYQGEEVALKVLRVLRGDPDIHRMTSVSASRDL